MFLVGLLWRMRLDDIILKLVQPSHDWETRGGRIRPEGGHAPVSPICYFGVDYK